MPAQLSTPKAGDIIVLNSAARRTSNPPAVITVPAIPAPRRSTQAVPLATAIRQPALTRAETRLQASIQQEQVAYSQALQAWAANIRHCLQGKVPAEPSGTSDRPLCTNTRAAQGSTPQS
jgi:hypothetical protein